MGTEQVGSLLATAAIIFLLVLLAVGLGVLNVPFPEDQLDKQVNTVIEALKVTATVFGGFAVLINAYYAAKRAEAMDKTAIAAEKNIEVGLKNVEIGLKNAALTEERLVTERFTKAIEQLGNDNLEIRLGGIYALERIAKDSSKDHWTIMEVLTSFIQRRSPFESEKEQSKITVDIQAAISVVGRRDWDKDPEQLKIDLSFTNLKGARLQNANFKGAVLICTNFEDAILNETDFREALLLAANFEGARLISVNFADAKIATASLKSALVNGANFTNASIANADLRVADIRREEIAKAIERKGGYPDKIFRGTDSSWFENLTPDQIKLADGWEHARYHDYFRRELGLP
ncbi:pentapeptide repeat-containing protein [Trichocoleus desertorum AS-A10]|uniref:pentapeptide repeat-containing protein n=1 Tax=Trichocoleus desertorum TaxID=1481672 RepID=UPI003297EC2C